MNLFEYHDYKAYVLDRIKVMPLKGRGQFQKLAHHLRMHTSRVSHIFRGTEDLTSEQACRLSRFFEFNELETLYFVTLTNENKAGIKDLKAVYQKELVNIRNLSTKLEHRVSKDREFTEQEKAVFYSTWYYSAIRLATSITGHQTREELCRRFYLTPATVEHVVTFLLSTGLCVEANGKLHLGPTRTHLESQSPFIARLHANWRLKALERHPTLEPDELGVTAPMSIPIEKAKEVREALVLAAQKAIEYAGDPTPTDLYCLNIDWFRF